MDNKRLKDIITILQGFDFSIYWLQVLVNLKSITVSEAGYIINHYTVRGL